MASKNLEMGYLLDFYGEVLTPRQREMMSQYYHDDLSLSEIGENFGITRQGARDAIKHGENAVIDARFACTGPHARLTNADYVKILNRVLTMLRSIDEVNES